MSKGFNILILGFQVALTFIATFCIYMVFALFDNDLGFDGLFGLFLIQPLIAIVISGLTILICLLLGLPIRLNKKINYWWTTNFYISIIGTFVGLTLLFLAALTNFREASLINIDGQEMIKQIPNSTLTCIGWILTTFSILHSFPPRQMIEKIKTLIQRVFKNSFLS